MGPSLGSQPCPLGLVQPLRPARPGGRPLFAPNRHAPLILNRQPSREKVTTFGLRQILLRAQPKSRGIGYAMFPRFPSPGPLWAARPLVKLSDPCGAPGGLLR